MILILLVVLVIAIIIFAINKNSNKGDKESKDNVVIANNTVKEEYVQVLEDGTKLNTSEQLSKTKQVGPYKFKKMQLTEKELQNPKRILEKYSFLV